MNRTSAERLRDDPVPKLLFRYFLTTFVALALNSVYTITDALFVGWGVGDDAMGGVSLVMPFVLVQGAISTALGGGAASLISRFLGDGKKEDAASVAFNARVVFYLTAILITVVGFAFMEPILSLFGATGDLYRHAKTYYVIILAGNVFSTGFSSVIRAEGKALYAMMIWVVPVTVNIVLDAVLILALGLGVEGSAFATVGCQFTSFLMSLLFFFRFSALRPKKRRLNCSVIVKILKTGLPALIQSGALSLQLLIVNNVLGAAAGNEALEAFAYVNKYVVVAAIPSIALMQAVSPVAGFHYGANNTKKVKTAALWAIGAAIVLSIIELLVAETIPKYLMMAFTADETLIGIGANALKIIAVSLPFAAVPMVLGAIYQAEGKIGRALFLFAAPALFLCASVPIFARFFGLDGVWWGFVAANALAAAAAAVVALLRKKSAPSNPDDPTAKPPTP